MTRQRTASLFAVSLLTGCIGTIGPDLDAGSDDAASDAGATDTVSADRVIVTDAPQVDAGPTGSGTVISDDAGLLTVHSLMVTSVPWNVARTPVGMVHAVAESGDQFVVFGSTGATLFGNGVPVALETNVRSWRQAATIPAASMLAIGDAGVDGGASSDWMVGVDGTGQLHRMVGAAALEPISDRYGLGADSLVSIASVGDHRSAFASRQVVAVADSAHVTRYDLALTSFTAGGGRIAGADGDIVRVGRPSDMNWTWYVVPGLTSVVLDRNGALVVATAHALYLEDATHRLVKRYTSTADIHSLAAARGRVWFKAGSELGDIESGVISVTAAMGMAASVRLIGSPSGEVWTLGNGVLGRLRPAAAIITDRDRWESNVRPVFGEWCIDCHSGAHPSSLVNLETYDAWAMRRALIYMRVFTTRSMPPPSPPPVPPAVPHVMPLSDRTIVANWAMPPATDAGVRDASRD